MAAAKAELDGLRRPQRTYNPLTIIQIKNAERNLDSRGQDSQWWSVWHLAQYYSRLRLCATAFLCLGLLIVGLMLWSSMKYNCQNDLCQNINPSVLPNRLKRNAQWSKTYEDIGKRYSRHTCNEDRKLHSEPNFGKKCNLAGLCTVCLKG